MKTAKRWLVGILVAAVTCTVFGAASAAPSEADQAFDLFSQGEVQFKAGSYDAAASLFERAYTLQQDPAYLFNVALAFEKQGRWPLAVRNYERFLKAHGDLPNAPEIKRRLEAARTSREATRAIVAVNSVPTGATVTAETHPDLDPCITPCEVRIDPGPLTLVLTLGDARQVVSRSLGPAEQWQVFETLVAPEIPLIPIHGEIDRTGSIVAWGAGGAALITGVVFGAMASGTHSEGKDLADGGPLGDSDLRKLSGLRDDLQTQSTVADISFGVAIVGGIVGAVLWLTADEPDTHTGELAWRF